MKVRDSDFRSVLEEYTVHGLFEDPKWDTPFMNINGALWDFKTNSGNDINVNVHSLALMRCGHTVIKHVHDEVFFVRHVEEYDEEREEDRKTQNAQMSSGGANRQQCQDANLVRNIFF